MAYGDFGRSVAFNVEPLEILTVGEDVVEVASDELVVIDNQVWTPASLSTSD